ncbi:MAG: lipopolysaccharide heptosyltransferase II [Proteobacteria bacterium]|nr:lipopolysaccharide heptosyltransferase II [Pseudomonadota bacterium]MBU1417867.1 lipopolysaccharide heptosyltransferase II [Pseudomonadota bacterium]MBU1453389.1 lipopolysaccharide heptosyltransferase II [Pseudomonadota bacterium]
MNDTLNDILSTSKRPVKILIIKPSALGDIVHSLPFLAAVHKRYPEAEIHWVVAKGLHTFLEGHPLIERLWIMNKDGWKKISRIRQTLPEIKRFWKGLRAEHFDISVDLSGLLRSGLITWAAGARCKLGFSDSDEGSPFFYTHKIQGGDQIHAIDRYLKLARLLDCDTSQIEYPFPPLPAVSELSASLPAEFCIMAPSAGKEANRWPAERFGQLAAKLPLPTVVISSPADSHIVEEVVATSNGKAINLAGQTGLKELVSLIAKARFFICNDTGPMHIAAALDVPVFALFGPANPVRTGPYGTSHTIIRETLPCSPCYAQKPCTKYTWRCMNDLTVEKVLHVIQAIRLKAEKKPTGSRDNT